jgi:hypothetical protein
MKQTKNTEGFPSVFFVRRQVESNHIPFDGTSRLSDGDQDLLTSTSPNLRNVNYIVNTKENNISNNEDAVPGSVNEDVSPTDNRYNQYTQSQGYVK